MADQNSTHSTLRERVVEHVFVGEALRTLWRHGVINVEVLRPEFDAHGYDLVMARGRIVRHIQFKTGRGKKPGDISIARSLASKPAGCVIWIRVSAALDMGPFFWFGGSVREPLPGIEAFAVPLRATHNKKGERPPRHNHREIPATLFEELSTLDDVLVRLLGEFRYEIVLGAPVDFTKLEIDKCIAIVNDGSALKVDCAEEFPLSTLIAIAKSPGGIAAVGVIKRARPGYTAGVATSAKFPLQGETPEFGYVAVDKEHQDRGLSSRIAAALVARHTGPMFATTDDPFMKSTLKKAGLVEKGSPWQGQRGVLSLWLKR